MPTNRPTIQPRGICPVCGKELSVLSDGTVGRPHLNRDRQSCGGYGMEAQQLPLPDPDRIKVVQSRHTGRWRVMVGLRLAYVCDSFDDARERAVQLADRERERAAELVSDLERERFGAP